MTYVSTRPVELAVVLNVEVDDVNGAAAVVLDDFVRTVVRTTTNDPGLRTSLVILNRESILTDIFPPDEFKGTVAIAVYTWTKSEPITTSRDRTVLTLSLVLADDDWEMLEWNKYVDDIQHLPFLRVAPSWR